MAIKKYVVNLKANVPEHYDVSTMKYIIEQYCKSEKVSVFNVDVKEVK